MKDSLSKRIMHYAAIILGSAVYAIGFDWFLAPNNINGGGLSGASLLIVTVLGFGGVGTFTAILNIPLFIAGFKRIGKSFFIGSLIGMLSVSVFLDLFQLFPAPETEPLLGALAGGVLIGAGAGSVLMVGASTGGADIIARLLKQRLPDFPIGKLIFLIDTIVVAMTGIVFKDLNNALYSAVALYVSSIIMDTLIYGMDYSAVALIISDHHDEIADEIDHKMGRGVTVLPAVGHHTGSEKNVLLTAIRKRQVTELKVLVTGIDPDAFVILQEAHQVLGSGFRRFSKQDL